MKLKSRAYVVTMGTILPGINSVRIDDENGVSHEVNGQSKDLESALFMCRALNAWRESYIHPVDLINMERAQNNQEKP